MCQARIKSEADAHRSTTPPPAPPSAAGWTARPARHTRPVPSPRSHARSAKKRCDVFRHDLIVRVGEQRLEQLGGGAPARGPRHGKATRRRPRRSAIATSTIPHTEERRVEQVEQRRGGASTRPVQAREVIQGNRVLDVRDRHQLGQDPGQSQADEASAAKAAPDEPRGRLSGGTARSRTSPKGRRVAYRPLKSALSETACPRAR